MLSTPPFRQAQTNADLSPPREAIVVPRPTEISLNRHGGTAMPGDNDKVKISWQPQGFRVDALGASRLLGLSDGDTPKVSMSIRMLSVDTPEIHFPANMDPVRHDAPLAQLGEWINAGKAPVEPGLAADLMPKLAGGRAGSLQKTLGQGAPSAFHALGDLELKLPSGQQR